MVKSIISGIAVIFIAIVLSQIILFNLILGFLLIVSLFMIFMGDIFIVYKLVICDLKPILEPTPMGKELMELQQIDGRVRFINTKKGPQGKRSFRFNGHDATVINDGKASFRLPNGNMGFRAHELFDQNVDPKRCKALEKIPGDNIKEAYHHFINTRSKKKRDEVKTWST